MSSVLSTMNNNLIIGRADYHKERLIVPYIKECISNNRNIVVLDPNKVLLRSSGKYLTDAEYSVLLIDIDNPAESSLWNPLLVPYHAYQNGDRDRCVSELYHIASTVMADDVKVMNKDPYWDNAAMDYFVGLSLILFTEADNENQINIENVYRMAKNGAEKFGNNTYVKEYVTELNSDPYGIGNILQTVVVAPSETKGSIEAVFYQKLILITKYASFFNASSKESIDMDRLLHEKTAIFIRYSEDRTTDLNYIKIFLSQLFHAILDSINSSGNILPFNYIFSDFLLLGYMTEFERTLISNSKNGNFFLIDIDSLSNAERVYGDNFSEYLISACQGIVVMPSNEIRTLDKINKLYELMAYAREKWISPYYLQEDTALAIIQPKEPEIIRVSRLDSEDMDVEPKINRGVYQVEAVDIKEIVNEKKKQRLLKMMNESGTGDPANSMSGMPYAGSEVNTAAASRRSQSEKYDGKDSMDSLDELMRIINQEIEETKLNENLNRIINKDF